MTIAEFGSDTGHGSIGKTTQRPKAYRCHLAIVQDPEGGFSCIVLNLPGAGSCGESKEEVIASTREAVIAMIASYLEDRVAIPWVDLVSYRSEIP